MNYRFGSPTRLHARWLGTLCLFTICGFVLSQQMGCEPNEVAATQSSQVIVIDSDMLRKSIDSSLDFTLQRRRLNVIDHGAWQVMHGILPFKQDFRIEDIDGKIVPAVEYLLEGGALDGWDLRPGTPFDDGTRGINAILEPGTKRGQGHADQWLAVLSQCGLSSDQKIVVAGEDQTLGDLIKQVQFDVPTNPEREYSWTLIGLSKYLPINSRWRASDGEQWSIERLVAIEMDQDIDASACGGTHRMTGITMALNNHLSRGGKLTGVWIDAREAIQKGIDIAKQMQNPDGSFSSNYFRRPGTTADIATVLSTTGHILEFLSLAMPAEQLREPWVARAAHRLSEVFDDLNQVSPECGALYHAAHGLVLYRDRRFEEEKSGQ